MLTVWGRKSSSNVQALMWCIGELNLQYERHEVGYIHGGNDTPEFLAMNPNGTIPVLREDGGEPLWETGAILRTLAGRHGTAPFWPREGAERARVDKWAEWAKVSFAPKFAVPIFWQVIRTAPSKRNPAAISAAVAALTPILAIAEAQLARGAYLAGADFTLADIQFGHLLYRYFDIPIERQTFPALRRYYDTLVQRPPFREHVMVSYEELRVLD